VCVCGCVNLFVNIPTLDYKKSSRDEMGWLVLGDHIPKSLKYSTLSVGRAERRENPSRDFNDSSFSFGTKR